MAESLPMPIKWPGEADSVIPVERLQGGGKALRLSIGVVVGAAVASGSAVVLGDYPPTGTVIWIAAVLVPILVGAGMGVPVGAAYRWLGAGTGGLSGAGVAWGVWIATGRGLDPFPAFAWGAVGLAVVWPAAAGWWWAGRHPGGQAGRVGPNEVAGERGRTGRLADGS